MAFAVAAFAFASAFAAWIAEFNPIAWMQGPALANGAAALSFDDRFGSHATLSSASIYYPSRRGLRLDRADFKSEFEQIEGLLAQQSRDNQASEPEQPAQTAQPAPSSVVAGIPLPRSRPAEANLQPVALQPRIDPPPVQADNRTMFQKLADLMPPRLTLASLTPGDGLLSSRPDLGALGYDNLTAVYDISARAVYMPNGSKLEAHSGLGSLIDDPLHVNERMRGATPPNAYDLKLRERPFHGVEALRMLPVGDSDTLGRSGLLVHSYMLGPNGDSNGCVSVKDYDKFLSAFKNGEVRRLVVVPTLNDGVSASRRSASAS